VCYWVDHLIETLNFYYHSMDSDKLLNGSFHEVECPPQ
jgi:hypothetical protein